MLPRPTLAASQVPRAADIALITILQFPPENRLTALLTTLITLDAVVDLVLSVSSAPAAPSEGETLIVCAAVYLPCNIIILAGPATLLSVKVIDVLLSHFFYLSYLGYGLLYTSRVHYARTPITLRCRLRLQFPEGSRQ